MAKQKKKLGRKFYFSVEGETEKWYLEWLQKEINAHIENEKITFEIKVQKDPRQFVKSFSNISAVTITHLYDYEGDSPAQVQTFRKTMDHMKDAEGMKSVRYRMGYSNLTFELWMILHKMNHTASHINQNQYLRFINQAYNETFMKLDAYKEEDNFKRLLGKLKLDNVLTAITNAKTIQQNNQRAGYQEERYKGFTYYRANPALSIHERIEELLKEVGIL